MSDFNPNKKINFLPLPYIGMFDLDLLYQTSDTELLYQILSKVNEIAESQNIIINNFEKVLEWANEQIEKYTKEQLQEWLDDGTLENMIRTMQLNYVTPEMYGAKGDGVTDDTDAFNAAIDTGLPILATKTYKVTTLLVKNCSINGAFIGTIICDYILFDINAYINCITIKCIDEKGLYITSFDKETNTTIYNSYINNTIIVTSTNGNGVYIDLLNGKGIAGIYFNDVVIKSNIQGNSAIFIKTTQTESSRPWATAIDFGIKCFDKFKYFIYVNDPISSGDFSNSFFAHLIFDNAMFQYFENYTEYCGYIRDFKTIDLNIMTFDFPTDKPIYYFTNTNSSLNISKLPLAFNDLITAIDGVDGFDKNIFGMDNFHYLSRYYGNKRVNVYDVKTDVGVSGVYPIPVMYPFCDTVNRYTGVAIPQSAKMYNTARGSCIFGVNNTNNTALFGVTTTKGEWNYGQIYTTLNCPHGNTSQRPIDATVGMMYFDTTLNKPIWYAGDKWVLADGSTA